MQLYTGTHGENWTTGTNWNDTGIVYCDWYGITCNEDKNIIGINLSNNNLSGTADLSRLTNLVSLDLSRNNLTTLNISGLNI